MSALPLRARIALAFTTGFALLLTLGATTLYFQLSRSYHRDFDHTLRDGARAARALWTVDRTEFTTPEAAVAHVVGELVYGDRTIMAFAAQGRALAASQRVPGDPYFNDVRPEGPANTPATVQLRDGTARVLHTPLAEGIELVLAMDTAPLEHRLSKLRLALFTGLPLILVLGGLTGAWASGFLLRPVVDVARAAERAANQVAEGADAFTPVPEHGAADELTTLSAAFNRVLNRLTSALARERGVADEQRRFLADAAHELRTPVAILRGEAEVALGADGPDAHRAALERIVRESEELSALVADLLLVARTDAGALPAGRERVFLDDLANQVVSRLRKLPMAEGREFRRDPFDAAPVLGEPMLLERALLALVHNALVHAPGSPVTLSTGTTGEGEDGWAWVSVQDQGPGIPAESRERVFDRFVRLDSAKPGSGLGLGIARSIAAAHGGSLTVEDATPGTRVILRLPLA